MPLHRRWAEEFDWVNLFRTEDEQLEAAREEQLGMYEDPLEDFKDALMLELKDALVGKSLGDVTKADVSEIFEYQLAIWSGEGLFGYKPVDSRCVLSLHQGSLDNTK